MNTNIIKWLNFKNLNNQIFKELELSLKHSNHAMSLNEFYVLYFLHHVENHELRMKELSEKIGLSLSATSRMLDKFEKNCQVIERRHCTEDKRGVQVILTQLGEEILNDTLLIVNQILEKYEQTLSIF